MIINLIKYEFKKVWKRSRYVLLGYAAVQFLLLFIARVFLWDSNIFSGVNSQNHKLSFTLIMGAYITLAILFSIFPFVESISRYGRDLSGKQAVLEIMIPTASWEKVISKLFVTVVNTLICIVMAVFSVLIIFPVYGNIDSNMIDVVVNFFKTIIDHPVRSLFAFINILFGFSSIYMVFFFCTAFAKSISHRSKISTPIAILTFVLIIICISYLAAKIQYYPIVKYSILGTDSSLSSTLLDIGVFAVLFAGTSWLMEKRIEL